MVRSVTGHIVPEVVPVEVEGVVDLHHAQAVLAAVVVVRLPVRPVEPLDSLVLVRPEPFPRSVLAVTVSSEGSHPEAGSVSRQEHFEQLGLEPVVDAGIVDLRHPGPAVGAENVCVISGHRLRPCKQSCHTRDRDLCIRKHFYTGSFHTDTVTL